MTTATLSCAQVQADDEGALRAWYDVRRQVEEHDLPGDPRSAGAGTSGSCAIRGPAPRCRPSWPTRTASWSAASRSRCR